MNLNKYIENSISKKIQVIELDENGTVIDSNNNLFPVKKGEELKAVNPFFESLQPILTSIASETLFPCVEFLVDNKKMLIDVSVINKEKGTYLILSDFTTHYNESNTLIQEKNESAIANYKLIFEKELFLEKEKLTNMFLANLSHELRAPLGNMLGLIYTLEGSKEFNYSEAETLRIIKKTGIHLESLLNDLLDISNIKQGILELKEVPFIIHTVANHLLKLYAHKALKNQLDFSITVEKDVPKKLIGDPVRLRQILINLIENAFKHTKTGEIKINISNQNSEKDTSLICFEVNDTGTGIETANIPKVFEQYYQINTLFNKTTGEGLGLKIVEDLVNIQKGKIGVSSKKGKGTSFKISIPYKTASKTAKKNKKYEKGVSRGILNNINILIVDNDEIDLMILTKLLIKKQYFNIELATNTQQALKIINNKKLDVILIDILMPEIDGIELIKSIKDNDKYKNIPIIVLSAKAFAQDKEQALALGVNSYITKPFNKNELLAEIKHVVQKNN